jgi:cell wall-associated NlpC family hydrolase
VRHTNEFWDSYGIPLHDQARQPGDLIFFSKTGVFPSHIGILQDEDHYIHAPGADESRVGVRPIVFADIARNGIARQIYTRNPIGFKSPTIPLENPTYRYHQMLI